MAHKSIEARGFVLGWIAANFLGVAVVGVFSVLPFLTSLRGKLISSLIISLPIGFAQWIVLRRMAPISAIWVLTIAAGLFLGISTPISRIWGFLDDESVLALSASYTTIGLLIGIAQWLLLRGHFARSTVWLLSNAAGLGLGFALVLTTSLIDQGLVAIIIVTLVYAITTALAMSWMRGSHSKHEGHLANHTT